MKSITQRLYINCNVVLIERQLHRALKNNDFYLEMQPILRLDVGAECLEGECLVRWQDPLLGAIPPDIFIPIAENNGLITDLGYWIMDNACRELARFIARGADSAFRMHVNASSHQLQQANFAGDVLDVMKKYGLQGHNLCIELTEGALLEDIQTALRHVNTLKKEGVMISLDDFGTGYSSFSCLHSLPFDQIKIDRQFIRNLLINRRSESIVACIISLALSLDATVVAEGIEDQETGAKLREMGCMLAQGYHYGRPLPFSDWTIIAEPSMIVQSGLS
ncbi:diguanylate cyclase/phosphodiesterase (GGDEF %26 EAL domains) with PAS/PAC sensor(s) [Enterobacter hormaechei]|uniref:putative bifunctional diguanylate cyclase/phosphodiesterase n=1 Tax=Enterobacter hormaechei TaxID=158836 RepID=UPI000794DA2E|nr:EAL domain-containing protein [Enterobacter hormaechei]CZY16101.1 diguanylate cyclase/phosphodiesterase (GGDEF %26 EAL domains) with PAS/PAC sensor(s) [Enterobacter hormaechei]